MPHGASRPLLIASICLLLAAPPVRAGAWTSIGPDGGSVQAVTFDPVTPSIAYATTSTETLKSLDGGLSWFSINPPGYGFSPEVVVDPLVPTTIYFPRGSTLFKSTDGGTSWTPHPTGEPYSSSLAIDPVNPSNLWIGGLGKIHRSTDGGVTWTPTALPPPATTDQTFDLAVDPVTPSTLYGMTSFATAPGVYRSVDAGVSFTLVLPGVPGQALAVDPVSPSTVFAGNLVSGAHRSTNGGTSWTLSNTGMTSGVSRHGLAVDPTNPLVVYAAGGAGKLHKSFDGGVTWTLLPTGLPDFGYLQSLVIDPSNPAKLLGGEQTGVAQSLDAGVTWTINTSGIRTLYIKGVTTDPTDPNVLYVTTFQAGVLKSVDGGATWAEINAGLGTPTYLERVLVDPVTPSNLYLLWSSGGGISRSLDGGATWIGGDSGIDDSVNALALAPSSPSTLYAATYNGVVKSVDGGASWNPTGLAVPVGDPKAIAVDPTSPDVVYVGVGTRVYQSIDGGASWIPADVTLSVFGGTVTVLGVDPTDSLTLYAGLSNGFVPGIYRSIDGGGTWSRSVTVPVSPTDIAFRPGSPSGVFVASQYNLFASSNRGTSWSSIADGLVQPNAVAVGGSTIYAGTQNVGLWRRSILPCTTNAECDDGNVCTTDTCNAGNPSADPLGCMHATVTCTPSACHRATCQPDTGACFENPVANNTACADDGTICTTDVCLAGSCVHNPVISSSCKDTLPKGSTLALKSLIPAKATLVWKWRKGDATTLGELGDPFNAGASDYTLCAFDRSGPGATYALAFSIKAPAGGTCGTKPCWAVKGVKVRYKDTDRTPNGADTLELVPGADGAAKIAMTAKGLNLTLPPGPLAPDVRLQLRRDDAATCWESVFDTKVSKNLPGLFKAKGN